MSYELFWHLNPTKLKPFYEAYKIKKKMRDEEVWLFWGTYGYSAFETVMAHFGAGLAGKKSKAKYIDKPIMQKMEENNVELTEEQKKEKTEQLFMQLRLMEANFNLNHKDNKGS